MDATRMGKISERYRIDSYYDNSPLLHFLIDWLAKDGYGTQPIWATRWTEIGRKCKPTTTTNSSAPARPAYTLNEKALPATELALVPTSFFRELGMALYKIDRIIARKVNAD